MCSVCEGHAASFRASVSGEQSSITLLTAADRAAVTETRHTEVNCTVLALTFYRVVTEQMNDTGKT